ncbi:MAG TPA: hypothetical protein VGK35_02720, partial [Actinotalea sp.]
YPAEALRFDDWETALRTALAMPRTGGQATSGASLLVIDEFPYLLERSPHLPSLLKLLVDEAASTAGARSATVVVCGSALSVMSDLLSGQKPLRGRAQLDLRLGAFDYRDARAYWGIADPLVAFHVDAILGGTPGYRNLVRTPPPAGLDDLPAWVQNEVLSPAAALYGERDYLLREDPRSRDRALFASVLAAVAQGARTQGEIGSKVGRDKNGLRHPLTVLEATGFLTKTQDVLSPRRPLYDVADPIVRFTQAVIDPYRAELEERDLAGVWQAAGPAFSSQVIGPHFEHLVRVWASRYAGERFGEPLGTVGAAVINDRDVRTRHELDLVAGPRFANLADVATPVVVIGEAKATNRRRTLSDLARLESIRALLMKGGRRAEGARLALFSLAGFDDNLVAEATGRSDVHLLGLTDLYED